MSPPRSQRYGPEYVSPQPTFPKGAHIIYFLPRTLLRQKFLPPSERSSEYIYLIRIRRRVHYDIFSLIITFMLFSAPAVVSLPFAQDCALSPSLSFVCIRVCVCGSHLLKLLTSRV